MQIPEKYPQYFWGIWQFDPKLKGKGKNNQDYFENKQNGGHN